MNESQQPRDNNVLIRSGEAPAIGWSRIMLYSGFNALHRSVFWSADFNGRSDNTDVIPLGDNLRFKIRSLLAVIAICAIFFAFWIFPSRPAKLSCGTTRQTAIVALNRMEALDLTETRMEMRRIHGVTVSPGKVDLREIKEHLRLEQLRKEGYLNPYSYGADLKVERYWHLPRQKIRIETIFENDILTEILIWNGVDNISAREIRVSVVNPGWKYE